MGVVEKRMEDVKNHIFIWQEKRKHYLGQLKELNEKVCSRKQSVAYCDERLEQLAKELSELEQEAVNGAL